MANDPSTTAREFGFGTESRPSLTDWLIRDLRIASSTERPAPPAASRDEEESASIAAPPKEVETELESFEPQIADAELERYEAKQRAEAIDDEVGSPIATSAFLAGAAVASVSHEVLPPPLEPVEREPATIEATAPVESPEPADTTKPADAASKATMSPPEDWLEEDEMGSAGAFFTSNADFDESDESAPVTDEGMGASLSPHVLTHEDEEEENEPAAALMVAGVGSGSSRWKTIAAIAAAVLLALLFGQRLAKRRAQAAAPPPAVTIGAPKAPVTETPREEIPVETEESLAVEGAKAGKGTGLGGGRTRGGADSPSSDPGSPGGPSVARFPDLPREILNQLEQVFESDSIQKNKSATESSERYTR